MLLRDKSSLTLERSLHRWAKCPHFLRLCIPQAHSWVGEVIRTEADEEIKALIALVKVISFAWATGHVRTVLWEYKGYWKEWDRLPSLRSKVANTASLQNSVGSRCQMNFKMVNPFLPYLFYLRTKTVWFDTNFQINVQEYNCCIEWFINFNYERRSLFFFKVLFNIQRQKSVLF